MNVRVLFVAGLVFRFGLLPSGMANLAKVPGFLDLVGALRTGEAARDD